MPKKQPEKKGTDEKKKLKEEKTQFSDLDKGTEKKPKFQELLPKEGESPSGHVTSTEPPEEESVPGQITASELEFVCGNLWVVLYQLAGILKKGFEPLTENERKLYAPVTSRLAVKYHVADYMKDEYLLLGLMGIIFFSRY